MPNPYLSIIIPAYNEEHRLPETLEQVAAYVSAQPFSIEVIVVENGSRDDTYEVACQFQRKHAFVKALQEQGRGKGLAVRRGMLAARGAYRFMCDADLSMPIGEINRFLPPSLEGADIVIASREAPGAVRYGEPSYRHWGGRAINLMIRLLALPNLQDTQCGFKCFRGEVAADLFLHQTITGWSFDIELLFIARRRGYQIIELPIPWYFKSDSKVHVFRDSLRMGIDIVNIHRNAWRGRYEIKV